MFTEVECKMKNERELGGFDRFYRIFFVEYL